MPTASQKPQRISVPNSPSEKEFLDQARFLWRKRNNVTTKRGAPSEIEETFRACRIAIPTLIARKRKRRQKRHEVHIANNPSLSIYVLFGDCEQCEQEKLTRLQRQDVLREIRKTLRKLFPQKHYDRDLYPSDKTLDKHLFAWMMLHHNPKWLQGNIPEPFSKRIIRQHIDIFRQHYEERSAWFDLLPSHLMKELQWITEIGQWYKPRTPAS